MHKIIDIISRIRNRLYPRRFNTSAGDVSGYEMPTSAREEYQKSIKGDVAALFFQHTGRPIDKWLHYLEIYDGYISRFRGKNPRMLEIGVSDGGSIELWRKYLGRDAVLFGVDVDPRCSNLVEAPNQFRLGSQNDGPFLRSVVREMNGVDIVLDDGSHVCRHQIASFRTLYPLLSENGLYIIEDLHTSYWHGAYGGGFRRPGTGIEFAKMLIDDMHHWYHQKGESYKNIGAIHFHDSMVVIEKRTLPRPSHLKVPTAKSSN